ncbi:MAG: hypothetical protein KAU20_02320 [Nanoarchaeota archaeon]|nr:hypothetical protein [Nanoarchaeota archaeon]
MAEEKKQGDSTEIVKLTKRDLATVNPENVVKQIMVIQKVMKDSMKDGVHYGKIEGCGDKPTLLQAGAQKLSFVFRLAPYYEPKRFELEGGHREYEVITTLKHIQTGEVWGQGVGSCSSMESKYRFRQGQRACPDCGVIGSVIRGKPEFNNGIPNWLCWKKKEGCGATFEIDDKRIIDQDVEKVENENPADQFNTILKMAKKRSYVDATINATSCSELFTQDLEDGNVNGGAPETPAGINTKSKVKVKKGETFDPVKEIQALLKKDRISEAAFKAWVLKRGYKESKFTTMIAAHFDDIVSEIKLNPDKIRVYASIEDADFTDAKTTLDDDEGLPFEADDENMSARVPDQS